MNVVSRLFTSRCSHRPASFLHIKMKIHPSANLPPTHPLLVGSTPKAPLDPGTAEFIKGKPAIIEPAVRKAKDWRYYETTITTMHELEGAVLKEYKEGGSWREHYKTWRDACVPLGKSRSQIDRLIQAENESSAECAISLDTIALDNPSQACLGRLEGHSKGMACQAVPCGV